MQQFFFVTGILTIWDMTSYSLRILVKARVHRMNRSLRNLGWSRQVWSTPPLAQSAFCSAAQAISTSYQQPTISLHSWPELCRACLPHIKTSGGRKRKSETYCMEVLTPFAHMNPVKSYHTRHFRKKCYTKTETFIFFLFSRLHKCLMV